MEAVDIIYDHYKETCEIMRQEIKRRWQLTLTIIISMLFLSLLIVDEEEGMGIIKGYLSNQFGEGVIFKFKYINTTVIYTYLVIVMAYYQKNIQIERLYGYIHKVEAQLDQFGVTREGEEYLHCYPFMLTLVDRIYKWLFPALIGFVAIFKITVEEVSGIFWMNLIAVCLIVVLSVLYISYMCFNEEYFHKEHKDLKLPVRIGKYFKEKN